ncbi:MAG: leucine-rich repeat domain-containing protein [Lachnospiraceae bacterium]|nr:leucine-rich repeat domain-containing protein [Lachnospiraceae bacterium]
MKRWKFTSIIILAVLLTACGKSESANQVQTGATASGQEAVTGGVQTVPESTPAVTLTNGVYRGRNLVIEGRKYLYIEYEMRENDSIRLRSLVPEGEELIIPSEIDGHRVVEVGAKSWEDSPGQDSGYAVWTLWTKSAERKLTQVVLGEYVEKINDYAFEGTKLDKVVLSETCKEIGDRAFNDSNVKEINLEHVEKVGDFAFSYCKLEKIHFDSPVIQIGMRAFWGNENMEVIELPASMKKGSFLGSGCFSVTGISEIQWPAFPKNYGERNIGDGIFEDCKNLEKVALPENQKHIYLGKYMFRGCKEMTLVIPEGTGRLTYRSTECADNYTENVTTLLFKDAKTKITGEPYVEVSYDEETFSVPRGTKFICVNRIIAPADSKAAKFAKEAFRVEKFTKKSVETIRHPNCEHIPTGTVGPVILETYKE